MINPAAWLLGLFLPACGAGGAAGLPVPQPADIARIERPGSPNAALAAPAGFTPTPDIVTAQYAMPAPRLFAAIRAVAEKQDNSFAAALYPDMLQAHYVVRSIVFNFPDLVTIQAIPASPETSTLVVYSRSVYGYSDLGANKARVAAWLAALLAAPTQSH